MEPTKNPLHEWMLQRTHWEKFVWKLSFEKDEVMAEDIDQAYAFLFEDVGVNPKKEPRTEITAIGNLESAGASSQKKIFLKEISKFHNVNAIPETEKVKFSDQLTIIYGENGSGKSGISRLLGNACFFRGRKELLPNVRTLNTELPSALFNLNIEDSEPVPISYILGDTIPDLQRFYVFDSTSSVVHLDAINTVKFTPLKMAVFDRAKEVFIKLYERLEADKMAKEKQNPATFLFAESSDEVATLLKNVSADTSELLLDLNTSFGDGDRIALEEFMNWLEEKERQDIPKKKEALKGEIGHLGTLMARLETLSRNVSVDKVTGLNKLISDTKSKKDLTEMVGSQKFVHEKFKWIGNDKWTTLISIAKELYDSEEHVSPIDTCILCQQPLSDKAKTLFNDYWEFLKGAAKEEYEELQTKVKGSIEWVDKQLAKFPEFEDSDIATAILNKDKPDSLSKLKEEIGRLKPVLEIWKQSLNDLIVSSITIDSVNLDSLKDLITAKTKEEQELKDPAEDLKRMRNEISKLRSKKAAFGAKSQFKEYKEYLVWLKKVNTISFQAVKTGLTKKRTEAFNSEVAIQYAQMFSEECKALKGEFGLEIYTKGEAQDSKKGLRLSFAQNYQPSRILSEGEQKVCSIADFLTEVRLDNNSAGIIFDDPVTSLDHARKDLIAQRLVAESKNRQVVILTHDIVFFLALQNYAGKMTVTCEVQTVKKYGQIPGNIRSDEPWIAMTMVKRVKYLKNELQRIAAVYNNGDADEYRKEIKEWCEYLREAWERSIEESLFKSVVTRFSPSIETRRLKDVEITDEHKKAIHDGMMVSSAWIHDQAAALNSSPPTPDVAKAWIESLEKYVQNLN